MHDTTARLYQAAAQLRQIHDIAELALLLAVSQQTLRNWEHKGLSKKGLQEATQKLGISAQWLQTGEGEMCENTTLPPPISIPSVSHSVALERPHSPNPVLDLRDWALRRLGLTDKHIISHIVNHDNMLPTLAVGDTVLIDPQIQQYIGSGIYALHTENGIMIYRINNVFSNGCLLLIHDNLAYPPEILRPEEAENWQIMGRVVGKYGVMAL